MMVSQLLRLLAQTQAKQGATAMVAMSVQTSMRPAGCSTQANRP